jgi:hypothetical protein
LFWRFFNVIERIVDDPSHRIECDCLIFVARQGWVDMLWLAMSSIAMAPDSPEREWPPNFHVCTSFAHIEALGIVSTIFNHLENTLFLSFWYIILNLKYEVARAPPKSGVLSRFLIRANAGERAAKRPFLRQISGQRHSPEGEGHSQREVRQNTCARLHRISPRDQSLIVSERPAFFGSVRCFHALFIHRPDGAADTF